VSGTYDDALSEGANMMVLMNSPILDYDAATIGNHSADYGREALMRNIAMRKYPVVLSNATDLDTNTDLQGTVPWVVIPVNGVRFGIFAASHDSSTKIDGVKMEAVIANARRMIPIVREKSDVVLMLAHLGLNKEEKWSKGLADLDNNNPLMNIDIIIDGHSHARVDTMIDSDTIVVQAGNSALCVGEISMVFDRSSRKVVSLKAQRHSLYSKSVARSQSFQDAHQKMLTKIKEENEEVVASNLNNFYFSKTPRGAAKIENKASEFVARSMIEIPFAEGVALADIGMVYQKGVRDNVAANDRGEITRDILHRIAPFGEPVVMIKRTGSEIEQLVRSGLKQKYSWAGLQVAFSEKIGKDGDSERNLISIKVFDRAKGEFEPLDKKRTYTVGAVDFFSKVFVRPAKEDVKTFEMNNKEVLLRFLNKYSKDRDSYFTGSDPIWPCNIYK
jgi:2',3'-cyclic-nucleotide 2'-phosphodiesterase (5'-nucleotidase family)